MTTAIEYLIEQCPRIKLIAASSVLEQALEMEKQQIIDFTDSYILECLTCGYNGDPISLKETEQYYNERFKKD